MEQNNPFKKRVEPILTERVYYVKSQQDKTVLVAMNVEIVGKYIKWFDCTKQRVMQIDKILQDDDSLFTFQRGDANHGFEYSFIKMALSIYNEHVKNELISPEEFTDEATMTESFQLTVRSAW